jgi:hypothetical protein
MIGDTVIHDVPGGLAPYIQQTQAAAGWFTIPERNFENGDAAFAVKAADGSAKSANSRRETRCGSYGAKILRRNCRVGRVAPTMDRYGDTVINQRERMARALE